MPAIPFIMTSGLRALLPLVVFLGGLLAHPFAAMAQDTAIDRAPVFRLVDRRLELMKPVAAYKYLNKIAVEDLEREAVVLARAREKAEAEGLDGATVERFFQRKIDAAKAIQRCWIDRWNGGDAAVPARAPDLKADIRPELIDIGNSLTRRLAQNLKDGDRFDASAEAPFRAIVVVDCLDGGSRDALFAALGELRLRTP